MYSLTTALSPSTSPPTMESLTENVWNNCIFPCLEYGDLVRLRRVSKAIKPFADEYLRNHFQDKERYINEDTLGLALQANLPTSSIYIDNFLMPIFDQPETPILLHLYGDKITRLKIYSLISIPCKPEFEFHFFSSFPNLLHLEIDCIDLKDSYKRCSEQKPQFPPNLKQLKTLKFGTKKIDSDMEYAMQLLEFCEGLEYFRHPMVSPPDELSAGYGIFGRVKDYIKKRASSSNKLQNLKYFDMKHVRGKFASSEHFCKFVRLCFKHQVKFLNVREEFIEQAPIIFATSPQIFTTPIISMFGVHNATFFAELPNMEKLFLGTVFAAFSLNSWLTGREREPPKWPSLKSLEISITSNVIFVEGDLGPTSILFDFLFDPQNRREGLRDLVFNYWDGFEIPRTLDVTASCPFVTNLTLCGWRGTDEQICGFWEGLPLLEEVTLASCKGLGDAAFVGQLRNENPVFLQLTKLKKFKLERLDEMPGITDESFELVFSRLKIKRFQFTCLRPIKSVTKVGIESLLKGDFNKSVEKCLFNDWSLDGVSEEELNQLKLRFRAARMI